MADGLKVEVKGLDEFAAKLGVALDRVELAAATAVYGQCIALAELANRKGEVPVRTGMLMNSLYVTKARRIDNGFICELGYAANYSAKVHESTNATYSGNRKWLYRAMNIHANALQVRLAESLRGALRSGVVLNPTETGIPATAAEALSRANSGISKYQRKYGFNQGAIKALRMAKKAGALKLVKRFKQRRKGKH